MINSTNLPEVDVLTTKMVMSSTPELERKEAKAIRQLDHDLKYSSLKLINRDRQLIDPDGSVQKFTHTELAVSTNFQSSSDGQGTATRSGAFLCWLAAGAFFVYMCIKFLCLTVLHYQFDYVSSRLWPTAANQDPSQPNCLTASQNDSFISSNLEAYREFIWLEAALASLNEVISSMVGFNPIAYNLLCSGIFYPLFICLTIVKILKLRFRVYDLISNRDQERSRFQCESNLLCESLFVCQKFETNGKSVYYYWPRYQVMPARLFYQPIMECSSNHQYGEEDDINNAQCFALRVDRKLAYSIEPAHLGDRFYARILTYMEWRAFIRWTVLLVPSILFVLVTLAIEFNNRVAYRLALLKCQSIDGVPSRAPIRLSSIESNAEFRTAYKNYDKNSLLSQVNLILIEARFHLTWGDLLSLAEVLVIIYSLSLVSKLFIELYAFEYSSKMCWLVQIEGQLEQCLWDLKQVIKSSRLKLALEEVDRQRNECLKSLTLAYLNFELFRRQQKEYQLVTNFVFAVVSLFQIQSLIVSYICCVNIKTNYTKFSLVFATYIYFILNAFLVTGSIRTGKALKLMDNLTRIVALSASSPMKQTPMINHWRNQMLDRDETKHWYAPKLLGISVTYDKLITMNAYLVLLWYILLFR